MGQDLFVGPSDRPDKYRLVRLEGSGGEASLWRAEVDLAGESETVAVKALRPEHQDDLARISARWAEQAELLRFVTHPGVVAVREHFEGIPPHPGGAPADTATERALYLVMNWVPGPTLRDWLLLHPGREGTVAGLGVLEQVAEALEMLHSGRVTPSGRCVVHGDLSPGNVVVTDDDRAVLVDFGQVRLSSHQTVTPAATPGYAAPEVWTRGEYSPAADRFGFAALGFFVLVGTPPPADPDDVADQLFAHPFLHNTPDALRERILDGFGADPSRRPGPRAWLQSLRGGASTSARTFDAVPRPRAAVTDSRGPRDAPRTRVVTASPPRPPAHDAGDVERRLAACHEGPGELVRLALTTGVWEVERSWWTPCFSGRSYHVRLRDRQGHDWVAVEMLLDRDGASRLVWADGAGGEMTECLEELADWLAPC
ncbi:serine/threonine-protein kinase [Actinomycetospora sp. TBRC 11914]|uniref:serine/threonine-protein kinase n=1 Tax=Actinomycetospora sp. TBRC 11914 TaxID=2729387 RepID=UPI00145F0A31|nr:serine/threonine-protein kinase [Actinomycetospora sp. TBRC 11914]NMO93893.1 protein kinase [Actinomycetospora sp. TBRC 11914]